MYSLIAGLLIPEKGQMRSQTDETSPEIPLDFLDFQTTVFPQNF